MTPGIRQLYEKLEMQKKTLLSEVALWSPAQVHFRPKPSAWSALDVLDHLVKVEVAVIDAVRSQLPDGNPMTLRDRVGALFILLVMLSPMRVKVPAAALTVLPEVMTDDASGIATHWEQVRGEMGILLQSLQLNQLDRALFRHPVSGWMTMRQAIAFLSAHLRHHEYQLDRLKYANREI